MVLFRSPKEDNKTKKEVEIMKNQGVSGDWTGTAKDGNRGMAGKYV